MDKENMNEFPEQEADLTADGQENLQAAEEQAPEREIGDDEATVSDEQTQVSFEETAEEPEDGDGDDFEDVVVGDPFFGLDSLFLDQRDHSIPSAESKSADFQKGQEQRQSGSVIFHQKLIISLSR